MKITKEEKEEEEIEINDNDLEELANQLEDGLTSGLVESETEDGKIKHIRWELRTEVWID